ncbi:dimethyladenosine transferase 2, mitochondrial [Canis lupus baileyi]|uniref:rRNA adenine N(6)-methyltransferase n=3 Tax=Canis lupus TaxID=9612 RepID=A0A8C0NUL5_CANLF|nr:dimethyladenosine transferase 2, mitochondrial [Canis lupus dingo]XP_038398708.1 dimethyladenosine transferase 2, mitochondrial [Canis lupus familiaris]XP_038527548.1 dimethyladenosine transferase 2, mitochondrial [Canis lupus familiaris]XP_537224.2 dimethyladenosine transferase 2, mitochondrial [Canis lupus familiaris]|eukprot:XP_537224.2 dimethyladenosine transferase 2, mitochondrial [Canis lupus familiaris]
MSVPAAGLSPRLALSALAGAGRFCVLGPGAARRAGVCPGHRRALSDLHPQLVPTEGFKDSPSWFPRCRSEPRSYITSPKLATTLAHILENERKTPDKLLLECNPGPGILTEALLKSKAKVIALESNRNFLPHLQSLRKKVDGELEVIYCDFFKMDPRNFGIVKPPIMISETLFQHLGIAAVPWSEDTPLRVVGIFPAKNEKKILWKLLYDLYSSTSVYSYGRVQLNMFITEREYEKLVASPETPHLYQVLSVLWQVACKIKLLHVEPWSSFGVYGQRGRLDDLKNKKPLEQINKHEGQNMCLIQLTPHQNLFTENLTSINYDVFFLMLKQCFMKRNFKLMDHLQLLSPVNAAAILKQIGKDGDMKITDLYPQDFKQLFEAIEYFRESCRWLLDDCMEEMIM